MLRSGIYLLFVNSTIVSLRLAGISWVSHPLFHHGALVGLGLSIVSFILYYALYCRRRYMRSCLLNAADVRLQAVPVRW